MRITTTHRPFAIQMTPDPFSRSDWPAWWVQPRQIPAGSFVAAYRLRFRLDEPLTVLVHVTADQRYELYCDGARIGRGPERGDMMHWFYESYRLTLSAGDHVLVARSWFLDLLHDHAPGAQMSCQPGFLLAAEQPHTDLLSTGTAPWEAMVLGGYHVEPAPFSGAGALAGGVVHLDGRAYPWGVEQGEGGGWLPVKSTFAARDGIGKWGEMIHPRLRPATLPPMVDRTIRPGKVRHVDAPDSARTQALRVGVENRLDGEVPSWQRLWRDEAAVMVPPHTRRRVLIDLDDYYAGYAEVVTTGGAGSTIRLHWAESLYEPESKRDKGDRNQIDGKQFTGRGDTFIADGGERRRFAGLWWNCGRYIEVFVETAEEPLTLNHLAFGETRYPLEMESRLDPGDPRFAAATPLMWRTLQMCAHETYMDCPYYEQLMYIGDTRIQALVTYVATRDDRLPRKAIQMFEASRTYSGLTQSRYPSRHAQIIPQFSLFWVAMVHDYALWRGHPMFIRDRLPGIRSVMEVFLGHIGIDALLRTPDGWNWVDWVRHWHGGQPPLDDTQISGINNWQLAMVLTQAAALERWTGDDTVAERYLHAAEAIRDALVRTMWDDQRGLFADTPRRDTFSEHAQCYALLSGLLDPVTASRVGRSLLDDPDLARGTIYFRHYLFEALQRIDRVDAILDRMDLWYDLIDRGLRTAVEAPEPSRSDCHAWSAHPIYHGFASVLGIRPASFGFEHVRIKPRLATLPRASGILVHPRGEIRVECEQRDGQLFGRVRLPDGLTGELILPGRRQLLTTGEHAIEADAVSV